MGTSFEAFHIQKSAYINNSWIPGTVFNTEIFTPKNYFVKYYDEQNLYHGLQNQLKLPENVISTIKSMAPLYALEYICNNNLYDLFTAKDIIENYIPILKEVGGYLKEIIFEEVRKDKFPCLPSRYNCIWLCEEEKVDYWYIALRDQNSLIYKVKATGKSHIADEKWLINDIVPGNRIREYANSYWTGELSKKPELEILFSGNVEIVRRYNNLNEFTESK